MKKLLLFWVLCFVLTGCTTMSGTSGLVDKETYNVIIYEHIDDANMNQYGELYHDGGDLKVNDILKDLWKSNNPVVMDIFEKHHVSYLDTGFNLHYPNN